MILRGIRIGVITAALVAAVCCGVAQQPKQESDQLIGAAAKLGNAPSSAVSMLETASPAPGEERLRYELWLEGLEASQAPPERWQRLMAANPPADLEARAKRGRAGALRQAGDGAEADSVLTEAMTHGDAEAAGRLVQGGGLEARRRAALWLAVHAPARLHRLDRALERSAVARLDRAQRLERVRAWLNVGRARTAVRELRGLRSRGALERARRLLLARCELEAGRPQRALAAVPRNAGAEGRLLAAEAWRARAWDRFPRSGWERDLLRALTSAKSAAAAPTTRQRALEIELESATETGRLTKAWDTWRTLEAEGWEGERRDWLGRRLGVALARVGSTEQVREIQSALPAHRRCLEYWLARRRDDRQALARLAQGPIPDLYAMWAARRLKVALPALSPAPALVEGAPPALVRRWLDAGLEEPARELWWRIAKTRGLAPQEALALASFEGRAGHWHGSIRALRRGFPALREGRLDLVPVNVVKAYLPLRFSGELTAAAKESGLPAWLLAGQARQESLLIPFARSPRGARGLLQLLPGTARRHARALGLGHRPDLEDPAVNLRLGARELVRLQQELGGLELALAAYNGGEARVKSWRSVWTDPELMVELMPVAEMVTYVRRVVFLAQAYHEVYFPESRSSTVR